MAPLLTPDGRPDVEDHIADHEHRAEDARLRALAALYEARYHKRMGNYRELRASLKMLQLMRFLAVMHRRVAESERVMSTIGYGRY